MRKCGGIDSPLMLSIYHRIDNRVCILFEILFPHSPSIILSSSFPSLLPFCFLPSSPSYSSSLPFPSFLFCVPCFFFCCFSCLFSKFQWIPSFHLSLYPFPPFSIPPSPSLLLPPFPFAPFSLPLLLCPSPFPFCLPLLLCPFCFPLLLSPSPFPFSILFTLESPDSRDLQTRYFLQ